jgi:hypothetical protein
MRAEPSIIVFAQKHHRHAIVNATNERIRLSDDYSRRQDLLATETRELQMPAKAKDSWEHWRVLCSAGSCSSGANWHPKEVIAR